MLPPEASPGNAVVVSALPPEPIPSPVREPDSPPVPPWGDEIAPAAEVPGVSIEPLPGAHPRVIGVGGLGAFTFDMRPAADHGDRLEAFAPPADDVPPPAAEPDLGADHLAATEPPPPPRPETRPPPRPRPVPASARVIEVPLPIPAVARPPVDERWQTMLARWRTDTDWRSMVFGGP